MKKTVLLVLSILLCTICFGTFAYAQDNQDQIIYLSDNGSDSNDGKTAETPFLTASAALSAISGDSAILRITDIYTVADVGPISKAGVSLIIEGAGSSSQICFKGRTLFDGDVYFRNISVVKTGTSDMTFWALESNLVFGENVSLSSTSGKALKISRGEYRGETVLNSNDKEIVINNASMNNVYVAGHIDATVKGSASATINGASSYADVVAVTHYGTSKNQTFAALGKFDININSGYIKKVYPGGDHLNQVKGLVKTTINGGTVDELYTIGRFEGQEGVVITEINGGIVKKIAIPVTVSGSEVVLDIPRVVILNNGVTSVISDTSAIVLNVAINGKAQAVTTDPTEENGWESELLGFEITLPEDKELVYINGELTQANKEGLYIIDAAGEYAVTFGDKYTVTIGDESEEYTPNEVVVLPSAPAKEDAEHYTFKWSDGENTYDAGAEYTVNADVTFTESWTAKKYTVTFKNGEYTVFEEEIPYGEAITAPEAPAVEGSTFDGWFSGDVKFEEETTVTGDVTYTAKYSKNSYDIEINAVPAEGGTVSGSGKFEYGTMITLTATPNLCYNFAGWYIGEEKVSDEASLEVEVRSTATYIAKFVTAPAEVTVSVVIAREEGTPYNVTYEDGTTYNNAAKLTIYDGENVIFTGTESADGSLEFKPDIELGKTYRVVVKKNGYLTFDKEIEVKTGTELFEIKLTPGDIKASYDGECGDGVIDIDDFIRVLRGFAAKETDKLFHAVDINEDRVVNVTDLAYIKASIGK